MNASRLTFNFKAVTVFVVRVAVRLEQVLELLLVLGLPLLNLPAFDLGEVQILHLHNKHKHTKAMDEHTNLLPAVFMSLILIKLINTHKHCSSNIHGNIVMKPVIHGEKR